MMGSKNCRCPHHVVMKVMMVLAWVAGILFFWSSLWPEGASFFWTTLRADPFWGFRDSAYWAFVVIVLVLLSKSTKGGCKCCCGERHCDTCPVQK